MSFQLSFRERHRYEKSESSLAVRTILSAGQRTVNCVATIDTGAAVCLFQRELAELLDLDLESGHPITLSTLTGSLPAWGHEVTIQTFNLAFSTTVYFAATSGLERNLLGKYGWLQQGRLGVVDYDEEIYLSSYNDPT